MGWIYPGDCWSRKKRWTGFFIAVREELIDSIGELGPHRYTKWPDFYQWPKGITCSVWED